MRLRGKAKVGSQTTEEAGRGGQSNLNSSPSMRSADWLHRRESGKPYYVQIICIWADVLGGFSAGGGFGGGLTNGWESCKQESIDRDLFIQLTNLVTVGIFCCRPFGTRCFWTTSWNIMVSSLICGEKTGILRWNMNFSETKQSVLWRNLTRPQVQRCHNMQLKFHDNPWFSETDNATRRWFLSSTIRIIT